MKKNQSFSVVLVVQTWKEILAEFEQGISEYPSVRLVSRRLAEKGYRTYRNTAPSREAVRLAMLKDPEGCRLLNESTLRFWKGNRYAGYALRGMQSS